MLAENEKILDRNYLTSEEMAFIAREMLNKDNALEREIVQVSLLAQILFNEEYQKKIEGFESCNDIYDWLFKEGIGVSWVYEIENIDTIEEVIHDELSTSKVVERFLTDLSEKIDEYAKNLNEESLKGLLENLQNVVNKKEV